MDQAHFQEAMSNRLHEISSALFALGEALVQLSLLLRDLQFEMDQEQRDAAEAAFREIFEKMRSGSGTDGPLGPR